jgi:hypothetical protein
MSPFADVPRKTAGGVGASAETDCVGTGTMPRACSVGNHDTGNCTGIALETLDVPAGDAFGAGAAVLEVGVDNDVGVVEVGAPAGVVAVDNVFAAVVDVARGGGTY